MNVLIVCGAGASSTFVAQRLVRAARLRSLEVTPIPSSATAAAALIPSADIVVAGAHLGVVLSELAAIAAAESVPYVVVEDVARQDGDDVLELILAAVAAAPRERIS